jgi:type I site-specific restriction endonuclease
MPTEADTCRKFVVPKLQASGWETEPHSIPEQRPITDGRIVPRGKGYIRRPPKRVDYLLRYTPDFPIAVVEAKREGKYGTDGLQQSKGFTYSLRQGIADGFLAPYRVHRIVTRWDATGWRPSKDELDRYGRPIPDEEYHTADFERIVSLRARTQATARHLTDFLHKTDRFAKVHELDADGKQLRVVKLTDYTAEKVLSLCASPEELRARWADLEQRAEVIEVLQDRGIDFQPPALQAGKPDADPFDLLCHLAFNAPVLTRRQRAERVKREEGIFFGQFGPEAREILGELLEKYAEDGELLFTLPDVLKVAPISKHGNIAEIVLKFGNPENLRQALASLQSLLYVA